MVIIDEIQVEYQKLFNECKPKHEEVKAGLDQGLNILNELKESPLEKLEENMKSSIDKLINPILLIGEKKVKRIYITSLTVLQKIIDNSLVDKIQSSSIIKCLEQICKDSNEEFVLQNAIKTLIPLINIEKMEITEEIIENIFKMSLKFFGMKGTSFKEPLTELINKLLNIICPSFSNQFNPIIKEKIENLQNIEDENEDNNNIINSEVNKSIDKNIKIEELSSNKIIKENENNDENIIKEKVEEENEKDEEEEIKKAEEDKKFN